MTTTHHDSPDPDELDDDATPFDPLAALTVDEMNTGSRHLKSSLVRAVMDGTQDYERALAVVLWLHRRRTEPGAELSHCMRLSFTDLDAALGLLAPAEPDRPTTPSPSRG